MTTHKPGRGRIYNSITETIGDTPLVRLDKFAKEKGIVADLLAKRYGVHIEVTYGVSADEVGSSVAMSDGAPIFGDAVTVA